MRLKEVAACPMIFARYKVKPSTLKKNNEKGYLAVKGICVEQILLTGRTCVLFNDFH